MFDDGGIYAWTDGATTQHVKVLKRTAKQIEFVLKPDEKRRRGRVRRVGDEDEEVHTMGGVIGGRALRADESRFGASKPTPVWSLSLAHTRELRFDQMFIVHELANYSDIAYWDPCIAQWKATVEKNGKKVRHVGYYRTLYELEQRRDEIFACQTMM